MCCWTTRQYRSHARHHFGCTLAYIFNLIVKIRGQPSPLGVVGQRLVAETSSKFKGHSAMEHGPRSTSAVGHYKSSEWQDWGLLFFTVTFQVRVVEKRLEPKFLFNFVDLVIGLSILLSVEIREDDLIKAEEHLEFKREFT